MGSQGSVFSVQIPAHRPVELAQNHGFHQTPTDSQLLGPDENPRLTEPVVRMTGISGRLGKAASTISMPFIFGMVKSVISRS